MSKFIQPEVAALGDNPAENSFHEVVMVVQDGCAEEALHLVSQNDGEVVNELPLDMYLISIPEKAITPLSQSKSIRSLQFEEDLEVLAGGNV